MKMGNSRVGSIIANARTQRLARSRARAVTSRNPSPKISSYNGVNSGGSTNRPNSASGIGNTYKNAQKKNNYNTIINSAESLQTYAGKMLGMKIPEDGAEESVKKKYKDDMVNGITKFVESYNTMIGRMNKTGDSTDAADLKELKTYLTSNKDSLKELGITITGNGTLNVDEKTLKKADVSKMSKLFATKGAFAAHIAEESASVQKRAEAKLNKILEDEFWTSFNYNNHGSTYNNNGNDSNYSWRG